MPLNMGLFYGSFGDLISEIFGCSDQKNINDQMSIKMQLFQTAQQQYYEKLKNYSDNKFQQEINKAEHKKFDFDEEDIIDAEFEIITDVKALTE